MEIFIRVMDAGSISAAAERLGIAKSAVSRRIAELEERLGAQLFRRTTRRLNPTEAARQFYARAVHILADADEAEQAVADSHRTLRGTLRVAVPLSFGLLHLAPAIEDFGKQHPQVGFDLDFNDRQVDLVAEGFDVALRIAELSDSTLMARCLAPIRMVTCASPDYLAAHGAPASPDELGNHRCLTYSLAADPASWTFVDAQGKRRKVRVPSVMQANNGDFLVQAAVAGCGITRQPSFIAFEAIRAGRLVPVLCDFRGPDLSAYAVYPHTRHLSQRVRSFVDYLVERFAGVPYWDVV